MRACQWRRRWGNEHDRTLCPQSNFTRDGASLRRANAHLCRLAETRAQGDEAILYVLSHGLRVSEVCALSVGDVIPPKGDGLAALSIRGKGSKAQTA